MRPIAIFYHCILTGRERPIDIDYAIALISAQMDALKRSGLLNAASEFTVGVNGDEADAFTVACMCDSKTKIVTHGKHATTEIHTLNLIREWLPSHPNYNVLYHHTKGVSTPNQADGWRRRMENACVWGWSECVRALDSGFDASGCHWLTPESHGAVIANPFFGGTFWWARSEYLMTLPPLPQPVWENRYEAETWIGKSPRRAKVLDFHPGWPTP